MPDLPILHKFPTTQSFQCTMYWKKGPWVAWSRPSMSMRVSRRYSQNPEPTFSLRPLPLFPFGKLALVSPMGVGRKCWLLHIDTLCNLTKTRNTTRDTSGGRAVTYLNDGLGQPIRGRPRVDGGGGGRHWSFLEVIECVYLSSRSSLRWITCILPVWNSRQSVQMH